MRIFFLNRTFVSALVLFGLIITIYLNFYDIAPADEIRVQVNGLGITDGEITARASELKAQDERRGLIGSSDPARAEALREAALHDLIQVRLVDYEVKNRQISREQVWDFLGRVKPDIAAQVKARYLQILESRAIILRLRDKNKDWT